MTSQNDLSRVRIAPSTNIECNAVTRKIVLGEREVDWDEFLAWAIEHKLDRDDDDSDDESLLQAADVKKRPSVQKASELQK